MNALPPLAVVGAGSMGGAILRGLLASGVDPASVAVSTRSTASAQAWGADGVRAIAVADDATANAAAVVGARVVLIGVKPAMVPDTLREIADALEPDALVVSVAAGVSIATMESIVPNPVVRAMPNTPALVRRAVTGIAAGSRTTDADLAVARALFEAVGSVIEVPESQINALSAFSGSGPAIYAFVVEQLTVSAQRLGFTEADARTMAEQTFVGTAELMVATGDEPAELRRKVTSPTGTTERIIAVLADADLASIFARPAAGANARAEELSAGS